MAAGVLLVMLISPHPHVPKPSHSPIRAHIMGVVVVVHLGPVEEGELGEGTPGESVACQCVGVGG